MNKSKCKYTFSTVEVVQYSTVGIKSVQWGIASVLWRVFSTLGDNISRVGYLQYCGGNISTVEVAQYSGDKTRNITNFQKNL